jgi:hypothetical protein
MGKVVQGPEAALADGSSTDEHEVEVQDGSAKTRPLEVE